MGIFSESASPFDDILEKVTAGHLTGENWDIILDICDQINRDPKIAKLALISIKKRLNNRDPHVIMLALSVLDSCWSNCGSSFRKEVSSASFINELQAKATHSVWKVAEKTRIMIKKWVEAECKKDSSLSLVVSLYKSLLDEGLSFESSEPSKKVVISNDPNVVHSQEEEDQIAKAIALSLQEAEKQPKTKKIYPTGTGNSYNGSNQHDTRVMERVVRALYDFEAAEDNELSFITGDVITVTDDSNPNWWRGRIGVQQGLFPSSFVTSDLSEVKSEPSRESVNSTPIAVIDESVLLKCIQLLEDCDPTGEIPDSPELSQAEAASRAQAPLIDSKLAAIDRQSNSLAQVDIAIRDVLALYDQAVQQANPYQSNVYHNQQLNMPQQQIAGPVPSQQPVYSYPNAGGQLTHNMQQPQALYQHPGMNINSHNQYGPMTNQPQQAAYSGYQQQYPAAPNQEWNQHNVSSSTQHQY